MKPNTDFKELGKVLTEIKYLGRLPYTVVDLLTMNCQYASLLNFALKKFGILDKKKNLIADFDNSAIIEKIIAYNSERQAKYTERFREKRNQCKILDDSDKALVQELRNRGYEVICKKIVEL